MPRVKVDLNLPGLAIDADDISTVVSRRGDKRHTRSGPYLIINRGCGLALDTALVTESGKAAPHLWPPHGRMQQLWCLAPSGVKNQVVITSAVSGLALDSGSGTSEDIHLAMCSPCDETWQHWRLGPTLDRSGYMIQSAHSGRFLAVSGDAEPGWSLSLEDRDHAASQEWLLALPYGAVG
jgi:Ricin-type beta-trefoil lectin domain-like